MLGGEQFAVRRVGVVGFDWGSVRVVVERHDKHAEGEQIARRRKRLVEHQVGRRIIELQLDMGREAGVVLRGQRWVRGVDGKPEATELPIGLDMI